MVQEIWENKYRWTGEQDLEDTFERVAAAIYANDVDHMQIGYDAMVAGLWMPGGRIIAGAGTGKRVTLMNCYVNKRLEDSLDDIMQGVSVAALTQQQGGGIGTDFSTLRPEGAILHRTGAKASGPLPFMDMWHSMCSTIMSAGDRRGAMMGTMIDTHPDLLKFIAAKQVKDRLTNFNVSVLVSDALMEAVREDEDWVLYFGVSPAVRDESLLEYDFMDEDGDMQYAYSVMKARELWDSIVRNTYEFSEPGIIFIDRINSLNNLKYTEKIQCTNPCGEQPLPPNGTCNLGAINLARIVNKPFTNQASIDWSLLSEIAKVGIRFLDNVIDVTDYPLPEQQQEELDKRRLGLGVSGLADCLAQMNIRYGSAQGVSTTEKIFQTICLASYEASMDLAEERGSFPLLNRRAHCDNENFIALNLSEEYKQRIEHNGIRNGVLLTVAPTGTTSILYGNISSGIEPVFAHSHTRRVRQADNTFREYNAFGYNYLLWCAFREVNPDNNHLEIPSAMVTAEDLTIEDHITTQAAAQRWVDASVSKTINVAENTTFEQFRKVYDLAYALGCKGCTTYRPSEVRGSILSRGSSQAASPSTEPKLLARPDILKGITHKVRWPSMSSALYITINYTVEDLPFEVFFNSKDASYQEWMTALALMISAILRKGGGIGFVTDELQSVHSLHDTAWIKTVNGSAEQKPKFFGSLIAYLGFVLEHDFKLVPQLVSPNVPSAQVVTLPKKDRCPQCLAPALEHMEGCKTCANCGYSNCQ